VLASSRRDEWLPACRVALGAILAWPDNSLVSISVPRALGISPARCVTQYWRKLDVATGQQLEKRNGAKVCHCLDDGHQSVLLEYLPGIDTALSATSRRLPR